MSDYKEKVFQEMSQSFQRAFGYSSNKHYRQSIPFYEKALEEDKHNFPALNNMAVAKIYMGIEEKNIDLIETAMAHLKDAITITKEVYKYPDGYPIAEQNLIWVQEEYAKLIQ